ARKSLRTMPSTRWIRFAISSKRRHFTLKHGESSQILLWPTYSTGGRFALDRVSLRGQIARLPRCNRHYLSAADPHTVLCLATRRPGSRRSPHGTRHLVAKVVGSLGPRTLGSASWRSAGR